ncbi:MAG: beta-Ala-His dipeptidase [Clostridia bacterium]|nr:beta-Ala-His dipeptidase [Clostridia bacterium]
MSILSGIKPERVFYYFEELSAIPRGSGNEEASSEFVESFAKERGLFCVRDGANNVFIKKSASSGCEDAPAVLLQGHLDMVCEKNADVKHDFLREGIKLKLDGDTISADGTTLGADDGIAVAVMMALLEDDDAVHGPLECLFTTGEEVGLLGMASFDKSLVTAKYMINLDSEEDDRATVSCAGGMRSDFYFEDMPLERCLGKVTLSVKGLAGGHSGGDIDLGRANAIKLAFSLISGLENVRLISVDGGSKDNAIPRECVIEFTCDDAMSAPSILAENANVASESLAKEDSGFKFDAKYKVGMYHAFAEKYSRGIITLVDALPYGPLAMCEDVEGLVETSSNPGIIKSDSSSVKITSSSRSSVSSKLDEIAESFESLSRHAGATRVVHRERYPGWDVTKNSALQKIYKEAYCDLFGEEPMIVGIHAGLECGLIKEAIPELDIISIGPNAKDIHTPDETLSVRSTEKIYTLTRELLKRLAK